MVACHHLTLAFDSGGERGLEVSGELRKERVGLLLDDRLTELSDLAEDGEIGLDPNARAALGWSERETQSGADPSAQAPVVGLGSHSRPPEISILFLHGEGAVEREADRADLQ